MDAYIHSYSTNGIKIDGGLHLYSTNGIQIEFSIHSYRRHEMKMEDDIYLHLKIEYKSMPNSIRSICGVHVDGSIHLTPQSGRRVGSIIRIYSTLESK